MNEVNPLKNSSLRLGTLEDTRKSLARIVRLYARGELEAGSFRNLVYGMSALLNAFKTEKTFEIESRIQRIEELLAEDKALGTYNLLARR